MKGRKSVFCLLAIIALLPVGGLMADGPVRGLVVDRGEKILWLGLPAPVHKGAVFDVMLLPGSPVIARAEAIDCTPDAPYVARAKFVMEDPHAFIPIGAYIEAAENVPADRDQPGSYRSVTLGPEGINPLSFSLGLFFPSDSDIRDETASGWPAAKINYRISGGERSGFSVGLGYLHADGDFEVGSLSGSREFLVVPLTVDAKLQSQTKKSGWFARVGAGAYYVRDERRVGVVAEKTSVTTFGWQAGIGYESKGGGFFEVSYTDVAKTDFKGTVFSLGARF